MSDITSYKSNVIVWGQTPIDKRKSNVTWSEDAFIRIYNNLKYDTFDDYLRNSGSSYVDYVVYVLYYDSKDNIIYLKDIREDVLYSIPNGTKSIGYTLAFKLNVHYEPIGS
jgi:hypothetical protein